MVKKKGNYRISVSVFDLERTLRVLEEAGATEVKPTLIADTKGVPISPISYYIEFNSEKMSWKEYKVNLYN